jgi:hypothetical protein
VSRRPDGRFDDEVVEAPQGVLELPEIGVRLAMPEIYEETEVARTRPAEAPAGRGTAAGRPTLIRHGEERPEAGWQ